MKKLKDLESIGFTMLPRQQIAYGNVGNYKYIAEFMPQQNQFSITTSVVASNKDADDVNFMDSIDKERFPFVNWIRYEDHILTINVKNKHLETENIYEFLQAMSNCLLTNGYVEGCADCKEEKPLHIYTINGNIHLLCQDCFSKQASASQHLEPVHFPLGVVGSLIGSLIGVAVWVILYKLGYVAGITGFIMAVCCFKGFEILGKRLDKKGIWTALIIAIVMLAVAEYISLGLEIHSVFSDYYTISIFDAIRSVPEFLSEKEVMAGVIKDLGFGYAFMAFASFSYVRMVYHQASTAGICEQLDKTIG